MASAASTASPEEIARFDAMAAEWWDPAGKFRPLHRFNPTRLTFIRDRLAAHFGRDITRPQPFAGLGLLDIGCGGGLLAEPLTRLGFAVTAIDAGAENIGVARAHAERSGLSIDYRVATPEALEGACYDAVLIMEIVEHVADLPAFLAAACARVKPGGTMLAATLNRTAKAYALGVVGAEYLLGWLPRGTHDWRKFVKPSELAAGLRRHGLAVRELKGMSYDPVRDDWTLGADLSVNYLAYAVKG